MTVWNICTYSSLCSIYLKVGVFFFLIFTCLHLDLWFSHVNSTIPVTIAALYIVCFKTKGNSSWKIKFKKKGRLVL